MVTVVGVTHDDQLVDVVAGQGDVGDGERRLPAVGELDLQVVGAGRHHSVLRGPGILELGGPIRVFPRRDDVDRREADRSLDDLDAGTAVGDRTPVEGAGDDDLFGDDRVVVVAGGDGVVRVEDEVVEATPLGVHGHFR